ncbi:MAG: ribonuclease Z [Acidimicrobiales bacterium]
MSSRQIIALGTASQAPTRYRSHNSLAVRWDDLLLLVDPGEATQRQCILAGIAVARVDAVCVTHFHGDHCLGLPGVIQRRALDGRSASPPLPELPIFHPAEGSEYLERLRTASIFHDTSRAVARPVDGDGPLADLGHGVVLSARRLDHRVPTVGYRIDEPPRRRFIPEALAQRGISGPDVGQLAREGRLATPTGTVSVDQVSTVQPGQSLAVVMDTRRCAGARALADGVDLLVCEATFLERHATLAQDFGHLTAGQAARLARDAGARRLVLTHFSARYPEVDGFVTEASRWHDDVVAATDLAVIDVPPAPGPRR